MNSPIEEIYEKWHGRNWWDGVSSEITQELWQAIKDEMALRKDQVKEQCEEKCEKEAPLVDWPPEGCDDSGAWRTRGKLYCGNHGIQYVVQLDDVGICLACAVVALSKVGMPMLVEDAGCGYSETSPDFPTPGHIIPETSYPDLAHLVSRDCQCKPQRNAAGYWVHRET